jgi:hypothetical protein
MAPVFRSQGDFGTGGKVGEVQKWSFSLKKGLFCSFHNYRNGLITCQKPINAVGIREVS